MENKIDNIIKNMLLARKDNLNRNNLKNVIANLNKAFNKNKKTFEEASIIDIKNNNGFKLDHNVIDTIINNILKDNIYYGDVTLSKKDNDKKIIYGHELMDIGNVIVITDGNPYVTIELAIRNIIAGNTTLIVTNGYMYGTNKVIVRIIKEVLNINNIDNNLINIYSTDNYDDVLKNYANIDLVIAIGNHNLQRLVLNKSKNRVITSGYEHFDLYIEDNTHIDFINKIIDTGLNINVYVNNNIELDNIDAIRVLDIDEAIAMINYNNNGYSASIFTSSTNNASKFIKEVKSKIVTINTSPTIERIIDIKQIDLMNELTIIYPNNLILDGSKLEFKIDDIKL